MTLLEAFRIMERYSNKRDICENINEPITKVSNYHRKNDGRVTSHYTTNDKRRTSKSYPRIIIENQFNIKLDKNEVVHHKDEDPSNNAIDNLEIITRSEHGRLHHPPKYHDMIVTCDVCGREFVWTQSQQRRYYSDIRRGINRIKTCSNVCRSYAGRMTQLGRVY